MGNRVHHIHVVAQDPQAAASACFLLPAVNFIVYVTPLQGKFPYSVYLAGALLLAAAFLIQRGRGEEPGAEAERPLPFS